MFSKDVLTFNPFRIQGQIIYLRLLIKDMMSLTLITQIGFLEIGHRTFFLQNPSVGRSV